MLTFRGQATHRHCDGITRREMLRAGEIPPMEFTRPEVAEVLIASIKEN